MEDYKTLHEATPLGFVFDAFKMAKGFLQNVDQSSLKDIHKAVTRTRKMNPSKIRGNIAKASMGLTCVFPVIVTDATDISTAVMISKAIERKAVGMLQMLFAAYQITDARDAKQYLSNFHHNISSSLDLSDIGVDDILDMSDSDFQESGPIDPALISAVCEDCRQNCEYVLETDITSPSIGSFIVSRQPMSESGYNVYQDKSSLLEYSYTLGDNPYTDDDQIDNITRLADRYYVQGDMNDKENFRIWHTDEKGRKQGDEIKYTPGATGNQNDAYNAAYNDIIAARNRAQARNNANLAFSRRVSPEDLKRAGEVVRNQVLDSDIKKANEATPSLMIINFITDGVDGNNTVANTCVIGVKAMLHYVTSQDLVNRVVLKNTDRRGLFNFIRATTREISFFKDFLFSVKKAKVDAIAKSGRGSTNRLWKLLELRANRLKMAKASNMKEADFAAITSVIISRSEVDYIKKEHRIDLSKPGTLLAIMRGYNLMAAAIVDEVSEKVDFLYDDGTKNFESLSFMSLEREESGSMYKKVVNLMAKGR